MRILQQFPLADDPGLAGSVSSTLQRVIAVRSFMVPCWRGKLTPARAQLGAENVKNINKNNALQAVRAQPPRTAAPRVR
jgi:hypothetical protein